MYVQHVNIYTLTDVYIVTVGLIILDGCVCVCVNPHDGQFDKTVETHQIDDYINGIHRSAICTISGV